MGATSRYFGDPKYFTSKDIFLSFNYTHTLEKLYGIDDNNILHIHGDVGGKELILGYPEGKFNPKKYLSDVTMKGRHFREMDVLDYIESIDDYYQRTAFDLLHSKLKNFKKLPKLKELDDFTVYNHIDEIIVIGHSYSIDHPYFDLLNSKFKNSAWTLFAHTCNDEQSASYLVGLIGISNYSIEKIYNIIANKL